MDLENERVLKLIFPDGVPENLSDNPELLFDYLTKLGTYKIDQLKKEQTRLKDESTSIVEQTQDLAISNYKTFIRTAENSRSIFEEFQSAEAQVNTLIDKLPEFSSKCEQFLQESGAINEQRHINTITLRRNAQLLEILELPQLMERCIREGRYEEALELAGFVQKMGHNQGHISAISNIVRAVEALWHTMLVQLVAQLRTDLQLPKCLQIVGYLRRMQAFGNNELKLKFLQARDTWLCMTLGAIPKNEAQQHLIKTIEVTRVNLFNIITQYRAIFPEDEGLPVKTWPMQGVSCDGERLFQAWLHKKIDKFLQTLELDLQRGINSFDTVLGQCMYFGLSFSRVGADFRALMAPIFVRVIRRKFESSIERVNESFEHELDKYTLINKVTLHTRNKIEAGFSGSTAASATEHESLAPPETLLDFHPLAALCNGYLATLNELRLCAPNALANDVTRCLQQSLAKVAHRVLAFYRQEQQAFAGNEREIFLKLCSCFAYDLIPYMQRCIWAIFPQQTLTAHLGINLLTLEQERITYLMAQDILEPLKHLLPHKVEKMLARPLVATEKEETKMTTTMEGPDGSAEGNVSIAAEG